eukprot:g1417.t1
MISTTGFVFSSLLLQSALAVKLPLLGLTSPEQNPTICSLEGGSNNIFAYEEIESKPGSDCIGRIPIRATGRLPDQYMKDLQDGTKVIEDMKLTANLHVGRIYNNPIFDATSLCTTQGTNDPMSPDFRGLAYINSNLKCGEKGLNQDSIPKDIELNMTIFLCPPKSLSFVMKTLVPFVDIAADFRLDTTLKDTRTSEISQIPTGYGLLVSKLNKPITQINCNSTKGGQQCRKFFPDQMASNQQYTGVYGKQQQAFCE